MKRQRPTIPLANWKLAVDIEATRGIQNQKGVPAFECSCEWCSKWKHCYKKLLPIELQTQLERVGIQLEHPTDLYKYENSASGVGIRVTFHAVGRILEGSNQFRDTEFGEALQYSTIRTDPYISLVVLPQEKSHEASPTLQGSTESELICIDFRLGIPSEALTAL